MKLRKKKSKRRCFGKWAVATNGTLTEDSIGNEWNLEDCNNKIQTQRTEMKNVKFKEWVLYFSIKKIMKYIILFFKVVFVALQHVKLWLTWLLDSGSSWGSQAHHSH